MICLLSTVGSKSRTVNWEYMQCLQSTTQALTFYWHQEAKGGKMKNQCARKKKHYAPGCGRLELHNIYPGFLNLSDRLTI